MGMKDRIKQLMESQHMTQGTFANYIGIAPATLCSILNERTKPTLNTVEAIRNKFPNINIDWLMFGNGTMFIGENTENSDSSTLQENIGGEQSLNFDTPHETPENIQNNAASHRMVQGSAPRNSPTQVQPTRTDIIYKEKERRRITEIRVFYDDQTWESFVPKK